MIPRSVLFKVASAALLTCSGCANMPAPLNDGHAAAYTPSPYSYHGVWGGYSNGWGGYYGAGVVLMPYVSGPIWPGVGGGVPYFGNNRRFECAHPH